MSLSFMVRTPPGNVLTSRVLGQCESRLGLIGGCDGAHIGHERVDYDSEEELLRFFAAVGVLLVRCGTSKAALAAIEHDARTLRTQL
jgi:hypothetical protein